MLVLPVVKKFGNALRRTVQYSSCVLCLRNANHTWSSGTCFVRRSLTSHSGRCRWWRSVGMSLLLLDAQLIINPPFHIL
jgi:hypothetical protein